jgi:HlyD family secretion protein
MKDRLPAGVTKEMFLKRFKERQAQGGEGHPMEGKGRPATGAPATGLDVQTLAHTPGGSRLLPGPQFTGSLALRSGMTANVTIVTDQRKDVLRVPNAALRLNPAAFMKEDKKAEGPKLGQPAMMGPQRPAGAAQTGTGQKGGMVVRREDRIWILENGKPKAVVVKAGITDGQFTEVSGENLREGMQILVGVENNKQAAGAPATPLGGAPGGGRR